MKNYVLLALLVTLLTLSFVSSSSASESILDRVKKEGVLRVGIQTTVPPMGYIDENGNWTGFDVDLAEAFAEKLGVRLEKVKANTKTRITFLTEGRIDASFTNSSHTRSREEAVDYVEPAYIFTGKIFYAKKGRFKNYGDLGGKRICVEQGSNAFIAGPQEIARYTDKKPEMISMATNPNAECFMALKQGKVDAFTQDSVIIAAVAGKAGVDYEPVGPIYSPGLYAIMVPENDSNWRDALSFLLQDMIKDGTYEKIYQKWFGENGKFPSPINMRPRLPEDIYGKDYSAFVWPD